MSEPAPHRGRRARLLGLLLLAALGYLAGVGVSAALGVEDPWTRGIIGIGPPLGGALAEWIRRRSRGA